MKYILGVDAGNTKTVALIARLDGTIVGSGRSGCGDIYNAGSPKKALLNVDEAVASAMRASLCRKADIVSAVFSMAGADWPEDFGVIQATLLKKKYGKRTIIVNDAVGSLKAGATDDWGVAVSNGTGAAISARSPAGKTWHASWWQEGGGGRSLGENALRAVYRSELGIRGKTDLTRAICNFYALPTVEAVLHRFTRRVDRASNTAPLARLVLDLAEEGDPIAREIVIAEGQNLGDYALAAARKVGIEDQPFPLILTGSVFKHESPLLKNSMLDRIRARTKGVTVHMSELEPCAGALLIALKEVNVRAGEAIRRRLKLTMPPGDFFHT